MFNGDMIHKQVVKVAQEALGDKIASDLQKKLQEDLILEIVPTIALETMDEELDR